MGAVLIFGGGYLGEAIARRARAEGRDAVLTSRDPDRRARIAAAGFQALDPTDAEALTAAAGRAEAVAITAPPDAHGCPGAKALVPALASAGAYPDWIGYVSSTAVYGDRAGGWVFEDCPLNAASVQGARRVAAEAEWLEAGRGLGLTVQLFRLPGLYGPGRSPIDRLRSGDARLVRKPGQIFNRIHVDDAAEGMFASMRKPRPGALYNLADDEPAPADAVTAWAARLMDQPMPPEVAWTDPSVSETMRRFYLDSKRVSNARIKAELGWRPQYPTYREGLRHILSQS